MQVFDHTIPLKIAQCWVVNIANLRRARGRDMIREIAKTGKIPYKTSFQIEFFDALRAPYALSKCKEVQAARFLTPKSRVAEKHSFGFTCFCPKSKSDRVDTAELICKSQINGHT